MIKINEKKDRVRALPQIMAVNLSTAIANTLCDVKILAIPLRFLKFMKRSLESTLHSLWGTLHQKSMSRLSPEKILESLERFGPSDEIYKSNSLKLHYTSGVDFMAKECRAWDLIMAIKPIFEMLQTGTALVSIKIEGRQEGRTKITYYSGSPDSDLPGEEYMEMPFPLEELTLFYAHGVLMLASEYRRPKYPEQYPT